VLYPVNYAISQVALQHDLPGFVQSGFRRADLYENFFARFVALNHFYQASYLALDSFKPPGDRGVINMLIHDSSVSYTIYPYGLFYINRVVCQEDNKEFVCVY